MNADELKSLQAPLKAQYRERPETALVTLRAKPEKRALKPVFIRRPVAMGAARVLPTCCSKRWSDAQVLR